jgi:hypothetical protein
MLDTEQVSNALLLLLLLGCFANVLTSAASLPKPTSNTRAAVSLRKTENKCIP